MRGRRLEAVSAVFVGIFALVAPLRAATLMVTNTADSGPGSLRQAILDSNASVGIVDTITFNVSGAGCVGSPAVCTIAPITVLPAISDPMTLDATTQPGYSGSPLVQIITSSLSDGLLVTAGGTTIQGLSVSGFTFGIRLTTNGSNTIQGNWIGLRADGSQGGNSEGIHVSSSGNQIGGAGPAQRNIVSTNLSGIVVDANGSNNSVQGNFVGTDPAGSTARPNGTGISINGSGNMIGGTTPGSGNLISGNGGTGLSIDGFSNFAQGNLIGTDATGTAPLPNGGFFSFGSAVGIAGVSNQLGGAASAAGNVVAFNVHKGVVVFSGTGNRIAGNSIHDNGDLGIDLGDDGITPNDPGDGDTGPNNLQNFPVLNLASISAGNVMVSGTLNSTPNTTFRVELFASAACDSSGYGEGQAYLGFTSVATDPNGNGAFGPVVFAIPGGLSVLTATATDPTGNTSEFSACFTASRAAQFYTLTPCRVVDTRNPVGSYGGPALQAGSDRTFVFGGQCAIPPSATAVAVNVVAVLPSDGPGFLTLFPGGTILPLAATINYNVGNIRANNAIIPLGALDDITVHCGQGTGSVHLVVDVNGYFQ